MSLFPVSVGQTAFPLRPVSVAKGPLPQAPRPAPVADSSFRLLDGPPYANGAPHLGHVLNKHLKDAVARAAHQQGHNVDWRPGWDCHGLPLELAVERQGHNPADRLAFVGHARAYATTQASLQAEVFAEQGWSADWTQPWHTHDPAMEAGTLRVFADLVEAGRVQVRQTAVPWCPSCQSTLAGAEQEDRNVTLPSWLVPFALDNGEQLLSWTTTPWTLPHHQGLVVAPDALYERLDGATGSAWVSHATAARWAQQLGVLRSGVCVRGEAWVGRTYTTPWHTGAVVANTAVSEDGGTGVLHAVAGLAELDTLLAATYGWPLHAVLAPDGRVQASPCHEQVGMQAGPAAHAPVRAHYEASPWFQELPYTTSHPHCWRHKVPVLTRASRQVFVTLDDEVRACAKRMVHALSFTPDSARARLMGAMESRPDWCVSRQRTWGVPLALFLDPHTEQPHMLASTWMRRVADAVEQDGVAAWWRRPSSDWLREEVDEHEVVRVDDVLDVWFDSGCVPQLQGSSDVVVEGTDQHRGWFQSCVWLAAALNRPAPFKRVVTHGFVVDEQGRKLSKSDGGDARMSRQQLKPWQEYPTDVVRLWALSGSEGHDKAWTQATVQAAQSLYARLRGVVRFLMSNALPSPSTSSSGEVPAWDKHWWTACGDMATLVRQAAVEGRTGEALTQVTRFAETFSSHAVGSWKDRLYCAPSTTEERQTLDTVVRGCLVAWGQMLAVLTPRLAAEARPFWSGWENTDMPPAMTSGERDDVARVLAWKEALAPTLETFARQKVAPGARAVAGLSGLVAWPGQLLADALDVGHLAASGDGWVLVDAPHLAPALGVSVGRSPHAVCPRCRRAQPGFLGEGQCAVCTARTAHVEENVEEGLTRDT